MPSIQIDNHQVEFKPGQTVLEVARGLGVNIPTLCHLPGKPARTSCMVCLVKVVGQEGLMPSCGTVCEDRMRVFTNTPEVLEARGNALELLLSDHLGDCDAPCTVACPAGLDIPQMLRYIGQGKLREAIEVIKTDIPLPAVLGRICSAPCEKACRRAAADEAVSIMQLKGYAAEADLTGGHRPYTPKPAADTGRSVAVVGAGPAGLSAAWHLRRAGHACTIFERRDQPGGMLRYALGEDRLPRRILHAEADCVRDMEVEFRFGVEVGKAVSLEELLGSFDAVFVGVGRLSEGSRPFGLDVRDGKVSVARDSLLTSRARVFAGGDVVRARRMTVRSVADGKAAAASIGLMLAGDNTDAPRRQWSCHMGRLGEQEMETFLNHANRVARIPGAAQPGELRDSLARSEARRCLRCDCRKKSSCKLRLHSAEYEASPRRFHGDRRTYTRIDGAGVVYEPTKCIKCGVCVRVAAEHKEPLGLTFVGRGFDVRVQVPFGEPLSKGLKTAARQCAAACPTGALAMRDEAS